MVDLLDCLYYNYKDALGLDNDSFSVTREVSYRFFANAFESEFMEIIQVIVKKKN